MKEDFTMSKGKGADKSAAVAELRARMLAIIEYIENVQDFHAGRDLRELIEAEAAKGNRRVLRLLSREVDAMANTLQPHERDQLHAILRLRFGIDSESERAELARWAASVVERGTIRSEKERRRLEDYLEMLTATGGDPAEIQAITSVLRTG